MNILHQVFQCLQYSHLKKIKNKHDVYKVKDSMKRLCESLETRNVNFKKKKMMLLTEEQEESFESTKFYYVCK